MFFVRYSFNNYKQAVEWLQSSNAYFSHYFGLKKTLIEWGTAEYFVLLPYHHQFKV